jgi:hypothetical protein
MTANAFNKKLRELGFAPSGNGVHGHHYARVVEGRNQHISRDNVRGSAWRLFLAEGEVPEYWPAVSFNSPSVVAHVWAESPWFKYDTELDPNDPLDAQCDSREVALEKCFSWFAHIGLEWLANPAAKTPKEWREQHNILVEDQV